MNLNTTTNFSAPESAFDALECDELIEAEIRESEERADEIERLYGVLEQYEQESAILADRIEELGKTEKTDDDSDLIGILEDALDRIRVRIDDIEQDIRAIEQGA